MEDYRQNRVNIPQNHYRQDKRTACSKRALVNKAPNKPTAQRVLVSSAIALLLLGCNDLNSKPSRPDYANDLPASEAPTSASPPAQTSLTTEDNVSARPAVESDEIARRLPLAGIEDPQEAKDFLSAMKTAAIGEDKDAIANLIHYPFTTYEAGSAQKEYGSSEAFLTDFDEIVTDNVLLAMTNARYEDLFINDQGVMIGDGEVWFMKYDDGIEIKSINSF